MRYREGEVKLKPDYIEAVKALPGRMEEQFSRGPAQWTVTAWRRLDAKGRIDYQYWVMPDCILLDMLKIATAECNCQKAGARDLAMERSGLNAIVRTIKEREGK